MCTPDLFLAVLAILFPPVAVWIKVGICTCDSIINIALCCLGYIPGLLHAWYIILKHPELDDEYPDGYQPIVGTSGRHGSRGNQVTYYYVAREHDPSIHSPDRRHQPRSYGTTPSSNQHQSTGHGPVARPAPPEPVSPRQQCSSTEYLVGQGEGEGSNKPDGDSRAPPTYAEAVKADNKIQS